MSLKHGKLKLTRTSTHKARTGCLTCKKRHVKCDEAKPHCSNCLKSRRHCEGYVAEQRKRPSGPLQVSWDSRQISPPRMQLQLDPDSLDFRDATGMLYFQEFVCLVQGPWTSAASNGDLWGVTLPQLARNNSTLRYAAMAIGALSRWHSQSTYESSHAVSVSALPTAKEGSHYFHAVAYYCLSLKLQSRGASVQDAIFLSVLLLFFETLRGNKKAALDHVNHGLAMLLAILTDRDAHQHIARLAPNPKPLLGAVADVFVHLALQGRAIRPGRLGHGPALPNLSKGLRIKKQTMESFMILLSQLPRSSTATGRIPIIFHSLDEFEEHWVAIRRGQTEMAAIMMEIMQASGILGSTDEGAINHFLPELLGHPRVIKFCETSRKAMQALDAAFQPLFNRLIMSDVESPTYLKAIHLRLQFLGVYIFDDAPQYLDIKIVHSQTPLFREYLSLAEIALRKAKREIKNPAHQTSLQCGLAWHLLMLAFYCRDPLARDEATWMLKDYPGQDGLWNTRSLYVLATRNRVVEQVNATEGTPAEQWQRLWRREFVFEDGGDRIVFRHLDKDEATGEWRLVEEAAEVQGESDDVHWKQQPLIGSGGLLMADLYAV